jgi:3-hydroxyacyl-CoA dehydrogenase
MGPFTLLDFVGLDTTYYIANIMFEFREPMYAPPLLKRMVVAGRLGRKSGQGLQYWAKAKVEARPLVQAFEQTFCLVLVIPSSGTQSGRAARRAPSAVPRALSLRLIEQTSARKKCEAVSFGLYLNDAAVLFRQLLPPNRPGNCCQRPSARSGEPA